jgi:hypothetical protein
MAMGHEYILIRCFTSPQLQMLATGKASDFIFTRFKNLHEMGAGRRFESHFYDPSDHISIFVGLIAIG